MNVPHGDRLVDLSFLWIHGALCAVVLIVAGVFVLLARKGKSPINDRVADHDTPARTTVNISRATAERLIREHLEYLSSRGHR